MDWEQNFIIIAISLGVTYDAFCLMSLLLQSCGIRGYFNVICNLCNKFDDSASFQGTIKENRKFCPLIYVGCYADHHESREVWTEYENMIKQYIRLKEYLMDKGDIIIKKFSVIMKKNIYI